MTRKTTPYARKLRRDPVMNAAAWLNTIQARRPYSAAVMCALRVREAYANGGGALLDEALRVARVRAVQIAGPDPAKNPMLEILDHGTMPERLDLYEEILMQMLNAIK